MKKFIADAAHIKASYHPDCVFNMDETATTFGVNGLRVLRKKGDFGAVTYAGSKRVWVKGDKNFRRRVTSGRVELLTRQ